MAFTVVSELVGTYRPEVFVVLLLVSILDSLEQAAESTKVVATITHFTILISYLHFDVQVIQVR